MFLKSTVRVTTVRESMKVVKMGLMSGEGFTEERKLQLGMSYARSIRDQINRQHHKYFETEAFEKPYLFSKKSHNVPTFILQ